MKKRTDLERICKLVVSDKNGLSKDDTVNAVSQMHKDEKLKLKWYEQGPASYKINKDCEYMEGYNGKGKEYDNKRVEDDKDHTLQDSFLDFLEDVCTPEQRSIYGDGAQKGGCQGMEDHSSRIKSKDLSLTPSQGFNPATNYGNLVEVIGKMADTLNSYMEMLRLRLSSSCATWHIGQPTVSIFGGPLLYFLHHFISFHFITFHFISFHFISFHFISFHFILLRRVALQQKLVFKRPSIKNI